MPVNATNSANGDLLAKVAELIAHAHRRVERGSEIPPRLLDIRDAARYLAMSDKSVRELIQQGELLYIQKIAGRSPFLLDVKDLDNWITRSKISLATPGSSR